MAIQKSKALQTAPFSFAGLSSLRPSLNLLFRPFCVYLTHCCCVAVAVSVVIIDGLRLSYMNQQQNHTHENQQQKHPYLKHIVKS